MSYEIDSLFSIRRERKQAIAAARVAATTETYLNNFRKMFADFEAQHFDQYIPGQMQHLRTQLAAAERELTSNPFAARETSMSIQDFIYNLRPIAREVKRQHDEAERERIRREEEERKAQKTESMNAFYEAIKQIADAAVQNAARADLATLRSKIVSGSITSPQQVNTVIASILETATVKAEAYKQKALENAKREGLEAQITQAKEQLQQENISSKVKEEQMKTLDELLNRSKNDDVEEMQKQLNDVNEKLLNQKISEDELLEAASYICDTLKSQGYNIPENAVTLEEVDGEKRIRVYALRSNNDDILCEVSDKNVLHYAINDQEFSMCLKDKQNFGSYLQQAYSIDLSDERIIWENPDRISKGEINIPNETWRNA